jgi:diacylglycerol kinase family enzyme
MVVIMNQTSGTLSVPADRELFLRCLRDAGLEATVLSIARGDQIETLLRPHLERGCRTVVAAGGDGTINAVASLLIGTGLAGTSVHLGVIPGGTLNHFAADLNIPSDLAEAVQVLKTGTPQLVDVGAVNGRIFLNNSGLGLYPEMVMTREEIQRRGFRKATALLAASALTLLRFPLLRVRLEVNGLAIRRSTPFVFVGNNPYEVEGSRFGKRSRLDTGELCLWVALRPRRLGLLRGLFQMAFQGLRGVRELDVLQTREATIQSRRRMMPVSIDGEVFRLPTPLHYAIRPRALSVIVPTPGAPR